MIDDRSPQRPKGEVTTTPNRKNADSILPILMALDPSNDDSTTVQLQPKQKLPISAGANENVKIVLDGLLILACAPIPNRRRILRLYYPGNVIRPSSVPKLEGIALIAARPTRLLRLRWHRFNEILRTEHAVAEYFFKQNADQEMRSILHVSGFGALTGEERVASLLIEFALRLGDKTHSGTAFDIPLSRSQMADYLALNPDTMSRIMSGMKAKGIFTQLSRGRTIVQNIDSLFAMCPLSPALIALHDTQ